MDVDPMEYVEDDDDDNDTAEEKAEAKAKERGKSRLNTLVAITVALLATFMGICKVKDDNIVQAMQQAQADTIDNWSYYQAHNIRAEIAKSTFAQLRLQALAAPAAARAAYAQQIAVYDKLAKDQDQKKDKPMTAAKKAQDDYDAFNYHDDQFDLSDAALSIAIALLAMTSLTQKPWLYGLAMLPTFFGVLMGLSGLLGWHIHPDALAKLLGT